MPKSPNQKLKLMYLAKFFHEQTDENHPATMNDIISYLAMCDIEAERKSIYDDLAQLETFGLDIEKTKSRTTGYYLASRDFELPELKLLVDSVQSSKFITEKKTLALIEKIEKLASRHDARMLQRQVFVANRVKSMNESVYYNVDRISDAIAADRIITFRYFSYLPSKERMYRKNGELYTISPFALMCDNENYYLLGYDGTEGKMKHFRVDKMTNVSETDERREGKEIFRSIDMTAYSKQTFGMFSGSTVKVAMVFANYLAGAVIDRFGKNVFISTVDNNHFGINVDVAISPQFYAWVAGFGADAEIKGPAEVREGMINHIASIAELYK